MTTSNQPAIEYRQITAITPYWNNPRNNEEAIEGLKKSISEFGFLVPIVLDAEGVIVTGHTRYKASQELGLEQVPVIVASHLDAKQIQAFRIADNRLSENAKWDETKLSEELRTLQGMGFDLQFTGFSKAELDCLCGMITASCLDDMDYATMCGEVSEKATTARDNVLVSIGNYKFYVSTPAYKAWETDLLAKFPKRTDIVNHLITSLGFQVLAHPATKFIETKEAPADQQAEAAVEGADNEGQ